MKAMRSMLTFYKSFALIGFLLTLVCLFIIYSNGVKMFTVVFWFILLTIVLIVFYTNNSRKQELYYYKNLGISKLKLWIPALTFDFLVFFVLMVILMIKLNGTHT